MKIYSLLLLLLFHSTLKAEDGYRLWLRYDRVTNSRLLESYARQTRSIALTGNTPTMALAEKELLTALSGLTGRKPEITRQQGATTTLLIETASAKLSKAELSTLGDEGFIIKTTGTGAGQVLVITANTDRGVLYGVFHFLRLLQTQESIASLNIRSVPRMKLRMLNHWDNLDRTVERGYAGFSIWNWHTLPGYIDQRYTDYARANASLGINGTVLTNVNANATVLTPPYLQKVKALADTYRPYGIKVYLTARFSAPVESGQLPTADPLDPRVQLWWKNKISEIYALVPDFGGFLVKANSEGQPGPQDYHRNHAEGANMLADAIAPFKGIVIWRAFVYSAEVSDDRHKQAYNEFVPLDGKFRPNVLVQVKNGAIDFMPREPFHPLFGAMPQTPLLMEFQVTQEYLGQGTHLVYLAPLFKECLDSDTYSKGKGSTVAKVVDGSLQGHALNGMAGVANIGTDINWTGHPFGQANWYALGRLAWDHQLSAAAIAEEWVRMSYTNDPGFVQEITRMMLASRETMVQYMNPIGLHHIMATGHHYGPAPWIADLSRPEWNPVYYHRADSAGIGFDRTSSGSNALGQYHPGAAATWADPDTCPEEYLLWFHHLPWQHRMKSGRSLWNELCHQYNQGVEGVARMQETWEKAGKKTDEQRYRQVKMLLNIQHQEAKWWRDACLLYFQTFSRQPIPAVYGQPEHSLDYYKTLRFPYAPGN
ncbi:alpha-glucuronidase family glycosyl hydrolase [Flavihumibacter stibioxidans]|uniref:Xylan alpha-1,2-glucuronidase n=1 Tax=Flavihumibacter stibioxidans TaxID=1834163 RepID=A0ABR7M8M1_9BACT|nr:alpha-glucuronidase family glycosyl hydrolase [Flavihumibacter stibioxidans]MBC6491317.1 alpha-glucuronidase [Flavihumibacter stibioxidans]